MTAQQRNERARPIAVVTGASSGIGQAIACELASHGFDIVVHYRQNSAGADQTGEQVRALGGTHRTIQADLAIDEDRRRFVEDVLSWKGCPHALVNNAGADVLTGSIREASFEEKLDRLWQTDVQATLFLARRFADEMRQLANSDVDAATTGLPTIVNMGWDQADVGMEADSGEMFGTIKGAVMAFTKALAKSCAPHVRVNAVAPGWIQTKWGDQTSEYWNHRATSESLLNRWGHPTDVARAVAFLCSPESSFINGQILPVNGGFSGRHVGSPLKD